MPGPLGLALSGFAQGFANTYVPAMQARSQEKARQAEIARLEELDNKRERLAFTEKFLTEVSNPETPDSVLKTKLQTFAQEYGLDPKGAIMQPLGALILSREPEAVSRGATYLTMMAGKLDPKSAAALEEQLIRSPMRTANMLEKQLGEMLKPQEPKGPMALGANQRLVDPSTRETLIEAIPQGEELGSLQFWDRPGAPGSPSTRVAAQVRPGAQGPELVGGVRDLGPAEGPQQPATFAAYTDKSGRTIITQGKPGDLGTALTAAEVGDFRQQQSAFETAVGLRNQIRSRLGEAKNPDAVIGIVGMASRFVNSAKSQALAAASLAGLDIGQEEQLLKPAGYNFSKFNSGAVTSAQVQTNLISLAYAIARTRQPGGQLSNAEVQQSLDTIAASSGSSEQMLAAIDEVLVNSHDALRARARSLPGVPEPALLGELEGSDIPERAKALLKEGVPQTFANGQTWTLRNGQPLRLR